MGDLVAPDEKQGVPDLMVDPGFKKRFHRFCFMPNPDPLFEHTLVQRLQLFLTAHGFDRTPDRAIREGEQIQVFAPGAALQGLMQKIAEPGLVTP